MFCKENYKVVIIMRFLLHQNIIYKMFLVDDLLNIRYLLELWRLIYIYIYYVLSFIKRSCCSHKLGYKKYQN